MKGLSARGLALIFDEMPGGVAPVRAPATSAHARPAAAIRSPLAAAMLEVRACRLLIAVIAYSLT
jgi:hypothetical protein